jgi:quinol monooxygenase YgiN
MVSLALYVKMKAKPGKEKEVESFLKSAQSLVDQEPGTIAWFAIKLGQGEYSIFDVFENDAGREAHLNGQVAKALFAKAPELFSEAPRVDKPELLASKVPKK